MTLDEARQRFAAARIGRLATVRPDGAPHAVPVVFATDGDRVALVVDDKPKRSNDLQRLRNLAVEPRASLLVDHYEETWTALWWVRADGDARLEDDPAARDRALDLLARKYAPYARRRPEGPVVVLAVRGWRFWSAS
jgi:PPOX class probable F420-dependent enzyme